MSALKRLGFRFFFVYAILYYLPFPLTLVAKEGAASKLWARAEEPVVLWIARHVFRATREIRTGFETGSGDTTYDWFRVGALVLVAALVAIAWWARERREHPRLAAALRIYVRYAVGSALVAYGMYKVIPVQFPEPAPERLMQALGEFSPMGFLWTFMGYSPAYNAFAGTGELVGGLLLFFRRTTMLGALIIAGVMANVVALNFTYDVPVKLYSSHLLLSAVLLLAPDATRLLGMFVLNRATRPRHDVVRFPAWTRAVKLGFVSWVVGSLVVEVREHHATQIAARKSSPLIGVWVVDQQSPETRDLRRFIVSPYGVAFVRRNDAKVGYKVLPDAAPGTLTLKSISDSTRTSTLTYRQTGELLVLDGVLDGEAAKLSLHRMDPSKLPLNARGFHWIQEYPFNR